MKSTTLYNGEVATVKFTDSPEQIIGTWGHPVYSLDRGAQGAYVPLGDLKPGERVRTADGWATLESLARSWTNGKLVYNIEVDADHRYLVGELRVDCHNGGDGCGGSATDQTAVHGNSKASDKPQHRYEIVDTQTDEIVKTGISGRSLNQNGTSPRANGQVNAWNKAEGEGRYKPNVVETNIPGRAAALEAEKKAADALRAQGEKLRKQQKP